MSTQHLTGSDLFDHDRLDVYDWGWDFRTETFETREEAEANVERFPKYARVRVTTLSTSNRETGKYLTVYMGQTQGKTSPDAVNKGVNETGDKRLEAIRKVIA